ncbi:ABC transporter substrate-binding protein [Anaerococcus sp. NML200574]|uniref:ABC transporter substrate-binding protein n=1 Tax=Anaerococcus sp. NML200574 TaxID=2954486 RepID=UPI002237E28A|nr:ABC transporter substrate-binding protein [Anaerococcus sp. NML200574]MCW6677799.1 ABC transporter substrate-binding protein [Anaerococcus sp. NML200574]
MNLRKKFAVGMLLAGLFLSACGNEGGNESKKADGANKQEASETIKLGNSAPLTGPLSIYGQTTNNGIKLALEEVNANGGILGKKVDWVEYDDKGEITDAVTNYNKLMEDKVDAIFGGVPSKPALAIAESSVNDGVLYITPTATQANITEGKPNVFRTCFTDPFQGEVLANFSKEKLNAKKVAILRNQSSDFSMGVADVFEKKAKELGMEVVADESYGDSDTDFKAQLTNVRGQNPDVLFIPDYYEKVALIAPQVKEAGIEATLVGADGWDTVLSVMDESSFASLDNSYFSNQFTLEDPSEEVQTFLKNYKEKFGENPSTFAAEGYDTVYLYKQAVEAAGTTEWAKVIEALKKVEFKGVTGSFTYDENNNPVKTAKMIRIENGEYKFDSDAGTNK